MSTLTARQLLPSFALASAVGEDVDVLVVGVASGEDGPELVLAEGIIDDVLLAEVLDGLVAVGATGKAEQLNRIPAPSALPAQSVVGVGLGSAADLDAEQIRRSAGVAARALGGVGTAATTLSVLDLSAATVGFALGAYSFTEFKSERPTPGAASHPVENITLLVEPAATKAAEAELASAQIVAEAVAAARELVNTPPSHLYPAEFALRAKNLADEAGLKVQILDDKALEKGGYGGIIGVGKGSSRPPRLVRISYSSGKTDAKKVALVGKGITFDTGGISIKPAAGMENMTSDMAGAAAVIATVVAAARLELSLDVTATVPMAENMPSSTAQRPGDVLTQYGGTTVEVLNTDAEGRLVLADAIVRACEDEPDYLIDTATLTGAQMVALGNRTPGVMGTDAFRDRVARLSQEIGENGWAMPMPAELRSDLDSKVADLANITNHRWGGMSAAAIFLREFVPEGIEWAHLDVAGPAYNTSGPWGYTGKGGTGVPVRTILAVLGDIAVNG